jgi:predicted metal-dependent enzyme (double-stranded beta helix superfamily)
MVETYQDLSVLVGELRHCFQRYRADHDITERVKAVMKPWVEQPDWITDEYRTCKTEEDIYALYQNGKDDIFISVICWRQGLESCVHDHNTWTVIGVAQGQENHQIWQRTDDRSQEGYAVVKPHKRLIAKQGSIISLPHDGIHSVVNNSELSTTIALHVYGGDLTVLGRQQYFPDENRCQVLCDLK